MCNIFFICTRSCILYTILIQTPALGDSTTIVPTEDEQNKKYPETGTEMAARKKGMVLPFEPLSLAFDHVNYYVDMPAVSTSYNKLSSET